MKGVTVGLAGVTEFAHCLAADRADTPDAAGARPDLALRLLAITVGNTLHAIPRRGTNAIRTGALAGKYRDRAADIRSAGVERTALVCATINGLEALGTRVRCRVTDLTLAGEDTIPICKAIDTGSRSRLHVAQLVSVAVLVYLTLSLIGARGEWRSVGSTCRRLTARARRTARTLGTRSSGNTAGVTACIPGTECHDRGKGDHPTRVVHVNP